MKSKYYVRLLNVLLIFSGVLSISAETTEYTPVFTSPHYLINARWSHDSTLFTFQEVHLIFEGDAVDTDQGFYTDADTWHGYDIIERYPHTQNIALISGNIWLLAPRLPPSALALPRATYEDGQISFVFVSPNGKFAVYAADERAENGYFPLAIANLQTGQTFVSDQVFVYALTNFTTSYHVIWSGDSSAFTIETTSAYAAAFVHHVTGYREDLNDITFTRLDSGIPPEDPRMNLYRPWALSYDGTHLLAGSESLFIWHSEKLSEDSITMIQEIRPLGNPENRISGATFTVDQKAVLYLDTQGIMRYDLTTGEKKLVDSIIKATLDVYGYFSPDATHLGIIENQRDLSTRSAYVIDIKGQD